MVTVLNMDYTFLHRVKVKRALAMIRKGKVTVEKASDQVLRSEKEETPVPIIIRMVYFIRSIYKRAVKWSKTNVKIRDGHTCVYCGSKRRINVDHVMPDSRGGPSTFENTVAACFECNNIKKEDRTPQEAGMFFKNRHFKPYAPTIAEFTRKLCNSKVLDEFLEELEMA